MTNPNMDPVRRDSYGNRMDNDRSNAGYWISAVVALALIIGGVVWMKNNHTGTSAATNNGQTPSTQTSSQSPANQNPPGTVGQGSPSDNSKPAPTTAPAQQPESKPTPDAEQSPTMPQP